MYLLNTGFRTETLKSSFNNFFSVFLESGYIEFEEFRTVFQPPTHDELLKTFKKFDKNDDGFLSPDEVKKF